MDIWTSTLEPNQKLKCVQVIFTNYSDNNFDNDIWINRHWSSRDQVNDLGEIIDYHCSLLCNADCLSYIIVDYRQQMCNRMFKMTINYIHVGHSYCLSSYWSDVAPDLGHLTFSSVLPQVISNHTGRSVNTTIRLVYLSSHFAYWYIHSNMQRKAKDKT